VQVRTRATSYSRFAWFSHEKLESFSLDLPETELLTTAYWLHLGAELVKSLVDQGDWTVATLRSYGPNWAEQRRRARERDQYRCRQCGRREVPGRQLDVHHLQPFRTFDYRPGENDNYIRANSPDNLISLCSDCHKQLETATDVQGTLGGLANLVHGLAPLFLMCDPRDLGMAVDLDMGFSRAPTVVIYDLVPGGVGFSQELYARHDAILAACLDRIRECTCEEGCPACVGAPAQPGLGAKSRVAKLLRGLVEQSAAPAEFPAQ
jgi:DEAD/DEAH box helicase domain-containing protein